jgi:hypothetical protein
MMVPERDLFAAKCSDKSRPAVREAALFSCKLGPSSVRRPHDLQFLWEEGIWIRGSSTDGAKARAGHAMNYAEKH